MVKRRKVYGHPSGFDPKQFWSGMRQPVLVKPNPVSGVALLAGNAEVAKVATAQDTKSK